MATLGTAITDKNERIFFIATARWEKDLQAALKDRGFRFHGERGNQYHGRARCIPCACNNDKAVSFVWWTSNVEAANAFSEYASPEVVEELKQALGAARADHAEKVATVVASRAADADIKVPAPAGLAYLGFQLALVSFFLRSKFQGVLLADEMGLGKTIQVLAVLNAEPAFRTALIIVPATLRVNWEIEAQKWLVNPRRIYVAETAAPIPADAEIVIVNFEKVRKGPVFDSLIARSWDLLVVDECHRVKNPKAQQTRAILGSWDKKAKKVVEGLRHKAKRALYLTGTPIPNRPIEIHPVLAACNPKEFGHFLHFAKRYCNAVETQWGWDFSGSSNLSELQVKARASVLVRRTKKEVLKELPSKIRQIIQLPANGAKQLIDRQNALVGEQSDAKAAVDVALSSDNHEEYEAAVARLREGNQVAFEELSRIRHELALSKVEKVIEHLDDTFESGVNKVVVFCHHQDVADALSAHFGDAAVVVTGKTPIANRHPLKERFQNDASCKLFIGNIQAAGVGLTLTAAHTVIFAELDWVPGNVTQAEDRCHRIGQDEVVQIQHLVYQNSLDAKLAHALVAKQRVQDAALDNPVADAAVHLDNAVPTTKVVLVGPPEEAEEEEVPLAPVPAPVPQAEVKYAHNSVVVELAAAVNDNEVIPF